MVHNINLQTAVVDEPDVIVVLPLLNNGLLWQQ